MVRSEVPRILMRYCSLARLSLPGEQSPGSAALGGDGEAVEFHEELIDEITLPLVDGVVQFPETAHLAAQGLDFAVQVRGKRGIDPHEPEDPVHIRGDDLGPVQVIEKILQLVVEAQVGDIPLGETGAELGPALLVQVRGNLLQIVPRVFLSSVAGCRRSNWKISSW